MSVSTFWGMSVCAGFSTVDPLPFPPTMHHTPCTIFKMLFCVFTLYQILFLQRRLEASSNNQLYHLWPSVPLLRAQSRRSTKQRCVGGRATRREGLSFKDYNVCQFWLLQSGILRTNTPLQCRYPLLFWYLKDAYICQKRSFYFRGHFGSQCMLGSIQLLNSLTIDPQAKLCIISQGLTLPHKVWHAQLYVRIFPWRFQILIVRCQTATCTSVMNCLGTHYNLLQTQSQMMHAKASHSNYSETSDKGPSEKGTAFQQRPLSHCSSSFLTSEKRATSQQRTKQLSPKRPLQRGSTV